VMDLPHVVAEAPAVGDNVQFVGGNMFESIPRADAVLLKVHYGLRFIISPCTESILLMVQNILTIFHLFF
jgi:hypothetical protein